MNLKWALCTRNIHPHQQLRGKLRQKILKLQTHLEHFPADAVHLQVLLEKHPRKPLFDTALTLKLPSNVLRVEKAGPDPVTSFDAAVKALLREVGVLKAALRHEKEWRRPVRGMSLAVPVFA